MSDQQLDSRQRAAATKRERTRTACLKAARKLFLGYGWYGTRLEDIAKDAGVSPATLHNHFPSKAALIGHIYKPDVDKLIEATGVRVGYGEDPVELLKWCVFTLALVAKNQLRLTECLMAARFEQLIRSETPPSEENVFHLVPLHEPIDQVIRAGQFAGTFKREEHDGQVTLSFGEYYTDALMMQLLRYPNVTAKRTSGFVLGQMLPALLA